MSDAQWFVFIIWLCVIWRLSWELIERHSARRRAKTKEMNR